MAWQRRTHGPLDVTGGVLLSIPGRLDQPHEACGRRVMPGTASEERVTATGGRPCVSSTNARAGPSRAGTQARDTPGTAEGGPPPHDIA